MAKLSKKEQALLKTLQDKVEAPDPPDVSRSAVFNVDLGDPEQVKRAMSLGLLGGGSDDDDDDDDDDKGKGGDDDDDDDAGPKRGGYFKD